MQLEENRLKNIVLKGVSLILWAVTAYLAVYEIFLVRSIVSKIYLGVLDRLSLPINVLEVLSATGLGNIASLIMAVVAIVIVVGGWDYHWKFRGDPRSFKLLGWTFAFQIVVLVLYVLL